MPSSSPANPDPAPLTHEPWADWARPLAVATAVVFVISSVFPVVAGLSKNTAAFSKWWGVLDVGIAFVLAFMAILIGAINDSRVSKQAEEASYRAYRILTHGFLVFAVVYMIAGDRIVWNQCLTGFAWRIWLLAYSLPAWFAAYSSTAKQGGPPSM